MVGILCITLGISSALGFVMFTGVYYVAFVGTIPFLVLGVGIDDMFIIIDAVDTKQQTVIGLSRLKAALGKVGASVTMTTITDMVAFAASSSSNFPAIQYFCIYAALAIFFSYVMIMTLLIAVLSLEIKRIESGRMEYVPCKIIAGYEAWKETQVAFANKVMYAWGRLLMKLSSKIIVIITAAAFLGVSIYGALNVEEQFDLKQLATDDSYFLKYLFAVEEFPLGVFVDVIQDDPTFDYTVHSKQLDYVAISGVCANTGYHDPNMTINWLSVFLKSKYCSGNNTYLNCTGDQFYKNLKSFLLENPMYNADLQWNEQRIRASRITCKEKENNAWIWKKDSMLKIKKDLANYGKITELFPVNAEYYYREQVALVKSETIRNLIICAGAVLVITTPYLVHPMVILIVFGGFVSLVIELFALMTIWNVPLNSISMIVSIMAIGFAVDYSAHIAHAFMVSNAVSTEERIIHALGGIGASVLMGGLSTFLGIVVMAFSSSEIFRIFFKMLFGIVVIGLLNGLLFLPVLLSVFCRTNVRIVEYTEHTEVKTSIGRINHNIELPVNGETSRNMVTENYNISVDETVK